MLITAKYLSNLKIEDAENLTLGEKWEIGKKIYTGLGTRTAKKFKMHNSHITMIVQGKRESEYVFHYLENVTESVIKKYVNNKNTSKEEYLAIEEVEFQLLHELA